MLSFSRQKFNSNFIVAKIGGGESRDFAQLVIKTSASTSKMHLTKSTTRTTMTAPRSIEVGRGNPFRTGDNTPQSLAVFLCLSIFDSPNLGSRFNIMMGLFGQSLRLVAPVRGISTPYNSVANTVESIGVGYPTFRTGITA